MNFVPNENSKDEFLCIWFVVSFIYVLHGNKNIFIVIVIVIYTTMCFNEDWMNQFTLAKKSAFWKAEKYPTRLSL